MGLYLECINLLMLSFLDRRLSPVERLTSVGCVKAVFQLWREASIYMDLNAYLCSLHLH